MVLIGVAPQQEGDQATIYSLQGFREAMKQIPGEKIIFEVKDAVREKVIPALQENPNTLFVYYDHGNENMLADQQKGVLINLNDVPLLATRETYTMACLSAKGLGKKAHEAGCKLYKGAIDSIGFTTAQAKVFMDCLSIALVKKCNNPLLSWADAKKAEYEAFTEAMQRSDLDSVTKLWLQKDRDMQRYYGTDGADDPKNDQTTPSCPVSRFILKIFGNHVLHSLRKIRKKLFGIEPGFP